MQPFPLTPENILGMAMIVSLTFYALMGGADYGGGVWDLLAFGPRAAKQRETITKAIGPIWEANHVWLILVIVLLFACFPPAFSAISISLHVPLTILLIGIVLRGSAFTFRTYDSRKDEVQRRWGRVFAISSTITPVILGIIVGAITSGEYTTAPAVFVTQYFTWWMKPFPIAVGFLALSLFAYLAAVYLTSDTDDADLQNDFRKRAFFAFAVSALIAVATFFLSKQEAPGIWDDISAAVPLHIATVIAAVGSIFCLWKRKFKIARFLAAGQVALILWGWALGQYPYLIRPIYTLTNSAANPLTLRLVIGCLFLGAFLLFPSFYYLIRIFKLQETPPTKKEIDI